MLKSWDLNVNSYFDGYLPVGTCKYEVVDDLAVLGGVFSENAVDYLHII